MNGANPDESVIGEVPVFLRDADWVVVDILNDSDINVNRTNSVLFNVGEDNNESVNEVETDEPDKEDENPCKDKPNGKDDLLDPSGDTAAKLSVAREHRLQGCCFIGLRICNWRPFPTVSTVLSGYLRDADE